MNDAEGLETLQHAQTLHPLTNWNRVLYVGMLPKTLKQWRGDFYLKHIESINPGFSCDVIEIDKGNIRQLEAFCHKKGYINRFNLNFFLGDITDFVKTSIENKYDAVIWWHGPEHLPEEISIETLKQFGNICKGILILGCPLGHDPYEDIPTGDKHHWDVYPEDFENIGFECIEIKRCAVGKEAEHREPGNPAISAFKVYE